MGNCLQVVKFRYSELAEEAFSEYLNFNDMMMMHHRINFTRAYLPKYLHTWNQKQENNFIDLLWKVTAHCTSDIECAS